MSAVRKYKRIQVLAKFEFPVTDKHLNLLIFALQSKLKVIFWQGCTGSKADKALPNFFPKL